MNSLLTLLFLLGFYLHVCKAQDDLLDGPSNNPEDRPMLVGSTVTLQCSVREGATVGDIAWQDVTGGATIIIYFNENKGSNQKHANFNLDSDGASKWNLVISNVEGEDSGLYACQNGGTTEIDVAERIVEKSATSITMTEGGTEVTTVTVREGVLSNIVCTSLASIPIIDITWMQQKDSMVDYMTSAAAQSNTSNADLTSDSVSTLQYNFTREFNGGMLTCKTSGQQLAEPKEDIAVLNVRHPPEITSVNYANEEIICTAEANPEVTSYAIIVNSEVFDPPGCSGIECRFPYTVTEEGTNIRCHATNTLGMDSAFAIVQPGCGGQTNTAAIVLGVLLGISIIIIVILLLYILFIQNQNSTTKDAPEKTRSSSEHPANVPQSNMELDPQTRQHESTNQQPSAKNPDPSQAYMDLNPQTRDDKTAYQELDKNAKAKQGSVTRVYEEIKDAKTTKQQDKEPQTYANVQPNKPRQAKRK